MAVREAPTGFMLIKRHVFDDMRQAYPDLQYKPDMIGSIDPALYYRFSTSRSIRNRSATVGGL